MNDKSGLAITLFGEILMVDQLARSRLSKVLPKGMELSHFSVLNHLDRSAPRFHPQIKLIIFMKNNSI